MCALEAAEVLALWERGTARHPLDRSAMLAAAALPETAPETIVDLPLGTVTASLLALRAASFGTRIASHVDCESCGERLAFTLDTRALLQPLADGQETLRVVEVAGLRVRAPCLRDLAAVAAEADTARAARRLLERCTLSGASERLADGTPRGASEHVADETLRGAREHFAGETPRGPSEHVADDALRAIEDALETLDPNADVAIALRCEACGHDTSAQLDAGALLWDEIEARAQALLRDVHQLARAYGWSEAEILGLGAARRASYLAMVAT